MCSGGPAEQDQELGDAMRAPLPRTALTHTQTCGTTGHDSEEEEDPFKDLMSQLRDDVPMDGPEFDMCGLDTLELWSQVRIRASAIAISQQMELLPPMNEWMDGWMDGWSWLDSIGVDWNEWMHWIRLEWMDGLEWMNGVDWSRLEWMDGLESIGMNGLEWMNEWMDWSRLD
jgi:hypothetical protein